MYNDIITFLLGLEMKKLFIVANWKSNKTVGEAEEWLKQVASSQYLVSSDIEIIICPPFTLLSNLRILTTNYHLPDTFKVGAQDVSPFPDGAYTGEVSARMLKDLGVEYVIIGHSERRKYFKEDEKILANKVKQALNFGLIPIYCVQDKTTPVPEGVKIIAYEPTFAIGTGNADTPENSNEVAKAYKEKMGMDISVLYGGSVNEENAQRICQQPNINGVLIGGASLDPNKFRELIDNASQI